MMFVLILLADLDIPITERSSLISPNMCAADDSDDGCFATPATEHSSGPLVAERCSSSSSSDDHIFITMVTEHSSSLIINETASISSPSATEPSSGTLMATEPCSAILINAVAVVPQVPLRVISQSPCVPNDDPRSCTVKSSGMSSSCSAVLSTTSSPVSTLMGLPQSDEDVLPLHLQDATYATLPLRPPSCSFSDRPDVCAPSPDEMPSPMLNGTCKATGQVVPDATPRDPDTDSARIPAYLHQPPPILTDRPSADDPFPAVVRCHDRAHRPDVSAAFPYPAAGHAAVYDVNDDPPQATLADDDVPCLRPSSTDVGRHTRPSWKSPPWTDGRLPPASSIGRGPSPHPHDGATSAFAHVLVTKRVSPAPAHGITPLGSVDVTRPFVVPWIVHPPAPPDVVGLTVVPHGHNPPKSPWTPG